DQFGALRLFDIAAGGFSYRVFMTPSCLQIDVSLAPAELFGALGPNFRLLFGKSVTRSTSPAVPAEQMFGQAVHHALRARVSIERGRFWQAEYWLSQTRQLVLYLLCLDHSLPPSLGRGIDDLPADVRARFLATLVGDLRPDTLESALREVVRELLKGPGGTQDMAAQVRPGLVCMARRQSLWTHEPPQTR
ncbi:MAG: hypothetical protein KC561_16395, partial [Myxococcales bacterium]|nr:hypothetical protein [Myxococcales bacterium]